MKKRVLALGLSLVLALGMLPLSAGAMKSETAGMSPACAQAYLDIVDRQARTYGGYASAKNDAGLCGGFLRDFDRNGTPELYLVSNYDDPNGFNPVYPCTSVEQVWTWTGNRAKLIYENEGPCYTYHEGTYSELHVVGGQTYYHVREFTTGMGNYEETGGVYTVQGETWKEVMSYWYSIITYPPENASSEYYTEKEGKRTYHNSSDAVYHVMEAYQSPDGIKSCLPSAGCVTLGFTPNGRELRGLLAQLAANQPSSWAANEVSKANKAGLVPTLTGSPTYQGTINRLQFCQMAVQLAETALGKELPAAPANTFTDCSDLAVRKAYAAGIVNGMTETTFSPNGTLTREQLATMLWRAVNYLQTQSGEQALTGGGALTGYTDAGSVSSYAKEAVAALNKNGIMKGTSNTALSPKGSCTVEQSILLSYRTFLKLN